MSAHGPPLNNSVVDDVVVGFYEIMSRFAPGCGTCSVPRRKAPGHIRHSSCPPFQPSSPSAASRPQRSGSAVTVLPAHLDKCCNLTRGGGSCETVAPLSPRSAMTPYGPAPPGGSNLRTCGSRCEAPPTLSTPYGPVPPGSEPNKQRAASADDRWRSSNAAADLVDQHLQHFLNRHPTLAERHRVLRKARGVYLVDGREIAIELDYSAELAGGQGCLMVQDGPMRQPFRDYVERKDGSAVYNTKNLKWSNLEGTSKDTRMTFRDTDDRYSRLDAMKVAKEQAYFREKAAEYAKAGHSVPTDLWQKYEKTMEIKLGRQRGSNSCHKGKSSAAGQQPSQQRSARNHQSPGDVDATPPPKTLKETRSSSTGPKSSEANIFSTGPKPTEVSLFKGFGALPQAPEQNLFGPLQPLSESSLFGTLPPATGFREMKQPPEQKNLFGTSPHTSEPKLFGTMPQPSEQKNLFGVLPVVLPLASEKNLFGALPHAAFSESERSMFSTMKQPTDQNHVFGALPQAPEQSLSRHCGTLPQHSEQNKFGSLPQAPTSNLFGNVPNFMEEAKARMSSWPQPAFLGGA